MNEKVGRLKRKGVVMTLQRLAVLEFLEGNTNHPSVEEIYRNLKKNIPLCLRLLFIPAYRSSGKQETFKS